MGLAVGLALCEFTVRLGGFDPLGRNADLRTADPWNQDCTRPASPQGYEYVPNRCGANSLGLQDRERSIEREPGELRILALGDSISADQMYANYLEELMQSALQRPVEVFNTGVSGYSTVNEVGLFKSRATEFDPDIVLLQFCLNDYDFSPVFFMRDGQIVCLANNAGDFNKVSVPLFTRSALYRYLFFRFAWSDRPPEMSHQTQVMEEQIGELKRSCQARDWPLLVILVPILQPLPDYPERKSAAYRHVLSMMERQQIPVVDMTDPFMALGIEELRRDQVGTLHRGMESMMLERGFEPADVRFLAAKNPDQLRVKEHPGQGQVDTLHPNFLGHYMMAGSLADYLLSHRDEFGLDSGAE